MGRGHNPLIAAYAKIKRGEPLTFTEEELVEKAKAGRERRKARTLEQHHRLIAQIVELEIVHGLSSYKIAPILKVTQAHISHLRSKYPEKFDEEKAALKERLREIREQKGDLIAAKMSELVDDALNLIDRAIKTPGKVTPTAFKAALKILEPYLDKDKRDQIASRDQRLMANTMRDTLKLVMSSRPALPQPIQVEAEVVQEAECSATVSQNTDTSTTKS